MGITYIRCDKQRSLDDIRDKPRSRDNKTICCGAAADQTHTHAHKHTKTPTYIEAHKDTQMHILWETAYKDIIWCRRCWSISYLFMYASILLMIEHVRVCMHIADDQTCVCLHSYCWWLNMCVYAFILLMIKHVCVCIHTADDQTCVRMHPYCWWLNMCVYAFILLMIKHVCVCIHIADDQTCARMHAYCWWSNMCAYIYRGKLHSRDTIDSADADQKCMCILQ